MAEPKKRKSGIPTGNAGEYFVIGELLRQGYDAQLADRNTKAYDILVGRPTDKALQKVQVKSVRTPPWYVKVSQFAEASLELVTIYVLVGPEKSDNPVRYFIAKNCDVKDHAHYPKGWTAYGFVSLKAVEPFEDRWEMVLA